jgi:hypothetical protein
MGHKYKSGRCWSGRRGGLAPFLIILGIIWVSFNWYSVKQVHYQTNDLSVVIGQVGQTAGEVGAAVGQAAGEVGAAVGEAVGEAAGTLGANMGSIGESLGQTFGTLGESMGSLFAGQSRPADWSWLWPLVLIAAGLFLIFRRPAESPKAKNEDFTAADF